MQIETTKLKLSLYDVFIINNHIWCIYNKKINKIERNLNEAFLLTLWFFIWVKDLYFYIFRDKEVIELQKLRHCFLFVHNKLK